MANTYTSKFKGVEVDEGVNIARNLAGTGGIEVKKTETGTINATVTIDGSGKQDKITDQTPLGVGTLTVYQELNAYGGLSVTGADSYFNHDATFFGNVTFNNEAKFDSPNGASFVIGDGSSRRQALLGTTAPRYATGNIAIYLPDRDGTLALLEDIPASPTGNFMPDTPSGPYAMLVASGGIGNTPTWEDIRDGTIQANFLVYDKSNGQSYHAHTTGAIFEAYNTGSGTLKKFTLMAPTGDAEATVIIPNKSGTLATLDDIPTGGGGSAGVSSIGGKTGAITLGTGLSMNGNELSAEGGGGTTYYQHLLRSKYTHGSVGCDYQFYMTVISTQSSEAGGLTDLVLHSANITVGIDAAQSGAPQDYAGFVPAIMIENPDDHANSMIFFVDTINNRSYAVAVEDTEFISDSVETL